MTYNPSYFAVTILILIVSAVAIGPSAFFLQYNPTAGSQGDDNLKSIYSINFSILAIASSSFVISIIKIWSYVRVWRGKEHKFQHHDMAFVHLWIDGFYVGLFLIAWFAALVSLWSQVSQYGCPPVEYCYLVYASLACCAIATVLYIVSAAMIYWIHTLIVKHRG